jgi:hypothetical protein
MYFLLARLLDIPRHSTKYSTDFVKREHKPNNLLQRKMSL